MKGVFWLASGLLLALLLVSGVSVGSQLTLPQNFFPVQDLKTIGWAVSNVFGQLNQGVNSQFTFLNNSAAVSTTGGVMSDWLSPIADWLTGLWSQLVNAWRQFLGLTPAVQPVASNSAEREQIRQELLAELRAQGLLNISLASSSDVGGARYGVMVAPSTGSTTRDVLLKQSLSRMFADQVDLKFDRTGNSGIVTPVFRDGRKGGDYIFVLTPLR